MALQGTLDTFELPDVLRLLASTKKSGRLHLRGDRGEGSVWLVGGSVVGVRTDASPGGDTGDGLFDLFRAREGGFAFEPGVEPDAPQSPLEVEPLLAATELRLAEWREIESVVPSLHAWVSLSPELPKPELTVDAATWRMVAAIGSGLTVGDLARILDLDEIPVSRVVRDLVVLGLGSVTDAPAPTPAPAMTWQPEPPTVEVNGYHAEPAPEPAYEPAVNGHDAGYGASTNGHDSGYGTANGHDDAYATNGHDDRYGAVSDGHLDRFDDTPAPGFDLGRFGADAPAEPAPVFAVAEPAGYGEPEPVAPVAAYEEPAPMPPPVEQYEPQLHDDEADADEVARQLAMLSPRAAQAVAAAAAADSDIERDAHLDALDDGDEPINRGLLLKFLSSVKS